MSNHFSKHSTVSIQRNLKVIGTIGWVCALLVILAPVIASLIEHSDFLQLIP